MPLASLRLDATRSLFFFRLAPEQVQSIEFSLVEKDVLYGLQEGNAVLKQLNKEMDLATVERLMDDTREGIAYQEASLFPARTERPQLRD